MSRIASTFKAFAVGILSVFPTAGAFFKEGELAGRLPSVRPFWKEEGGRVDASPESPEDNPDKGVFEEEGGFAAPGEGADGATGGLVVWEGGVGTACGTTEKGVLFFW